MGGVQINKFKHCYDCNWFGGLWKRVMIACILVVVLGINIDVFLLPQISISPFLHMLGRPFYGSL